MAQGGGVSESKTPVCLYAEDRELSSFILFLKSATWLYPISRFLGHAIKYYRYEMDFFKQEEGHDEDVEEKNWIIYENYYDLIGSLLSKFCREYDIKPSKVVSAILAANVEPGREAMIVRSFNFIRATYGVLHFGYMITNYCNLFKMKGLEDLIEETKQMKLRESEREHWQELWKCFYEEMVVITKKQKVLEICFSHNTTEMLKEMQYGPYIYTCGIKLCDVDYYSDLTRLLENINDLNRRKASVNRGISDLENQERLATEDVMRDDLAKLLRITRQERKPTPPPPALVIDLHELNRLKAEGLKILKQKLAESPASRELVTVSERLATIANSDKEPRYDTAPSSPVQLEAQEPEQSAKSKQKPSSNSPELQYATAPSSPAKTKPIQTAKESVAKPRKKSSSDSPISEYSPSSPTVKSKVLSESLQTAEESVAKLRKKSGSDSPISEYSPSSPTAVKSKVLSESPQELRYVPANLQIQRPPSSLKLVPTASLEDLTVPDNETNRRQFLLQAYDRRMTKQLAYMAAVLELQNSIGTKKGIKELIFQQRWFERNWPSPNSKTKRRDKAKATKDDSNGANKKDLKMLDEVFHGQAFLEVLWRLYDAGYKMNGSPQDH